MTAFTTTIDFMKLWTQSSQDAERKLQKLLLAGLDKIGKKQSDVLSKIKVAGPIAGPVVRWMEQEEYPTTILAQLTTATLTVTGAGFKQTVTEALLHQVLRVGTILERKSDGVQGKVTSISGISDGSAPWTCTIAAYGNTSLSDDSGAVEWDIISEPWSDFKDVDSSRALTRTFRSVGTQIHAETFEIPKTRENTKYELVANEVEHQIASLLEKLRRQIAFSVLRSRPYYSGGYIYGDQTETPTMLGVQVWPAIIQAEYANTDVYVNAASAEITKTMLNNLIRNMMLTEHADFNSGNWAIICHPLVHKYIQEFDTVYRRMEKTDKTVGFHVDTFDSDVGKAFPIISDQYLRTNMLNVVDFSTLSYGYYAGDQLDRKEIATQGRYRRWLISFQTYGVVARKPRHIGTIYSLATS